MPNFLQAQSGVLLAQQASSSWHFLLQADETMADQVEIYTPKTVINEGTQLTATARFRTRSTAAASTPTNVYYKLTNLQTLETVTEWTSLSAASEVTITLTPEQNTIRDKTHVQERMELLVAADYGLSTQAIGAKHYKIRDLKGYD